MITYQAIFKAEGICTKIPDAQTMFGAICQSILNLYGESGLDEYLNSFEDKPWFVHSTMMPKGFFPAFKQPLLTLSSIQEQVDQKRNDQKLDLLSQLKKYKKFEYVSQKIFFDYVLSDQISEIKNHLMINGGSIEPDSNCGISVLQDQKNPDQNFMMKQILQTRSGTLTNKLEKDLFYQRQLFFKENSRFMVYLHSNKSKEELKKILSLIEWTGTGPSSSSGFNQFHLESVEKVESPMVSAKTGRICLLSACLPDKDEFDLPRSDYGIESALYRTSYGYIKDSFSGRFNLLSAGSMMKPLENKEFYGQLKRSETKGKTVYHYGIGFVL